MTEEETVKMNNEASALLERLGDYNKKLVQTLTDLMKEIDNGRGYKGNDAYNKAEKLLKYKSQ